MRARWRRTAIVCGVVVACAAGGIVLRQHRISPSPAPQIRKAPDPGPISLAGRVQAQHVLPVAAPLEGIVDQFLVEVGQEVIEGQLLARIKSGTLEGARDAALLDVQKGLDKRNSMDAQMTSARLEASRASAVATSARALADRAAKEYQRQTNLHAAGATPRLVFERAERENERAKADWESAQAVADQANQRVSQLAAEIAEEQKLLDQKTQALEQSKEQLASGDVVAPVDGIVVARHGEPGEHVNPSIANLFEIGVDVSLLEVDLDAPPEVIPRVQPGAAAVVQILELGAEPIPATVKDVQPGKIVVTFVSPSPLLKPGLTAQVTIPNR